MLAREIIGDDYAAQVKKLSLDLYKAVSSPFFTLYLDLFLLLSYHNLKTSQARDYASPRGIILADTKFEFGLDKSTTPPTVILIDEILTPDSSRFWLSSTYTRGQAQESLDKQFLRDWLVKSGLKGKEGVDVPSEVVGKSLERYEMAFEMLVGKKWSEVKV